MHISMNLFQRPDNGIWYVRVSSRKRISLHTKDEREAKRLYTEIKKKWLAGKLAHLEGRRPEISLTGFLAEYGEHSCKTKSKHTWRADELALRKLIDYLDGSTPLSKVTRKHLDQFFAGLKVKATSKNVYLRHLKAAFNQAVAWDYLQTSPAKGMKEFGEDETPTRWLTQAEIARLLAAEHDPHFALLWKFLLLTGVRRSEVLQVQAKDIDLDTRIITIADTKHKKVVYVRILPDLEEVLAQLPKVGRLFPWTGDGVSHHFHRTAQAAGLNNVRLHDLRHTFASHLVMAGVELFTVSKLLNHSEMKTTQRYAHLSPGHLEEALAKLKINEE